MRAAILAGLLVACLMLAACASGPATVSARPEPVTVVKTVCPPLVTYSQAEQKAMADALRALPQASPLVGAMRDYGALRSVIRACKG